MSSTLSQSSFSVKEISRLCFTEFTTLSVLTIILSPSNVLNFVSIFLFGLRNQRPLFHRIYDLIYVDNYSFTIKCPQLCFSLLFQSKKTQGFCFTEFTTLSMLTITPSQSNVLNFDSLFFLSQRKPKPFPSQNLRPYPR